MAEAVADIVAGVLVLLGAGFALVAGIGLLRMPDLLLRLNAASKAGPLGVGLILVAAAVHFGQVGIVARALAAVVFILLTTPIAAHIISKAAFLRGVKLWEGTIVNDLEGHYDPTTHEAQGCEALTAPGGGEDEPGEQP